MYAEVNPSTRPSDQNRNLTVAQDDGGTSRGVGRNAAKLGVFVEENLVIEISDEPSSRVSKTRYEGM